MCQSIRDMNVLKYGHISIAFIMMKTVSVKTSKNPVSPGNYVMATFSDKINIRLRNFQNVLTRSHCEARAVWCPSWASLGMRGRRRRKKQRPGG